MCTPQITVDAIAGTDIRPFSFVNASLTTDNTVIQSTLALAPAIGVTNGDVRRPGDTLHAAAGEEVTLTYGGVSRVQASAIIAVGTEVTAAADGRAAAATGTDQVYGVLLEGAAAAGDVVRMIWRTRKLGP